MSLDKTSLATREGLRAVDSLRTLSAGLVLNGQLQAVSERTVQQLVSAALKLYLAKREDGSEFTPVELGDLTATDVAVAATGLLKAVQMEPFELTLWGVLGKE